MNTQTLTIVSVEKSTSNVRMKGDLFRSYDIVFAVSGKRYTCSTGMIESNLAKIAEMHNRKIDGLVGLRIKVDSDCTLDRALFTYANYCYRENLKRRQNFKNRIKLRIPTMSFKFGMLVIVAVLAAFSTYKR